MKVVLMGIAVLLCAALIAIKANQNVIDSSELVISVVEYTDGGPCVYTIDKTGDNLLLQDVCDRFKIGDTVRIVSTRQMREKFGIIFKK